jgi:hypothetical protein
VPWTSRTLDTLNTPEQDRLCDELKGEVTATTNSEAFESWSCTVQAWTASQGAPDANRVAQCQTAFDGCRSESNIQLSDNVQCNEVLPSLDFSCATVGELRECYRVWGPAIEQAYAEVLATQPANCQQAFAAGGVSTTTMSVPIDVPQQCLDIRTACGL